MLIHNTRQSRGIKVLSQSRHRTMSSHSSSFTRVQRSAVGETGSESGAPPGGDSPGSECPIGKKTSGLQSTEGGEGYVERECESRTQDPRFPRLRPNLRREAALDFRWGLLSR